jgi:hypothetical protein
LEQTLNMCAVSFSEQTRHIRVPTLVLAGTDDPLLTPDTLQGTVLAQIAGARMIVLPCGHEIPKRCGSRLPRWLRRSFQDWGKRPGFKPLLVREVKRRVSLTTIPTRPNFPAMATPFPP